MISIKNVTLQQKSKILFEHVSLSFYNKQKIGIVGANGCGKTSMFSMLLGELEPSLGEVLIPTNLSIAHVEQETPNADKPVIEYVIDANIKLRQYEKELDEANSHHDSHKIAELYDAIHHIKGFEAKAVAAKILAGLGFTEKMLGKPVNEMSGGWRVRLNVARTLFVPSEILLLDEPTNHLDLDTVIWLEKWLKKYPGLLLLISHDRDFLDKITTHTAHIERRGVKVYTGNYSKFETQRAEELSHQQKQYEKQQSQIAHIESYIDRFRAKASKARQAQSRIKALEKMRRIMPAHIDSPFSFEFKRPANLFNPLITIEQVSFGYDTESVLEKINFQLSVGDRIGLLGKNGTGKSTLIKLLSRELTPSNGNIENNNKLKIGYFAQHTLDTLCVEKTALEHMKKLAKTETDLNLRKFLGGFDFSNDMTLMPVKNFSGGEKARLALASIIWQAPNILLLDEPTNHLDINMRQALVLALQNYEGAVVIVSHDRFLLNQTVDNYYILENKKIKRYDGTLTDYQHSVIRGKNVNGTSKSVKKQHAEKHQDTKQAIRQKQNIKKLERKLHELETTIAKLNTDLIHASSNTKTDYKDIKQLQIKHAEATKQHQDYEEKWLKQMEHFE